jgi:hypothetical protein
MTNPCCAAFLSYCGTYDFIRQSNAIGYVFLRNASAASAYAITAAPGPAKTLAFPLNQAHNFNANDSHSRIGKPHWTVSFPEDGMDYQLISDEALLAQHASCNQNALLVASLLYLMSHYSARSQREEPCIELASVIERHLTALSRLQGVDPVLRATCEQLSETWGDLVDVSLPPPAKRHFLARLMRIDATSKLPCRGAP